MNFATRSVQGPTATTIGYISARCMRTPEGCAYQAARVSLVGEARVDHAVERDAVPGQLTIRFDKVPKACARLGVGGPRLHSAAGASGREDRCSEYA